MKIHFNIKKNEKYQIKYLAFIDILGFKNIVSTYCYDNPNYLLNIYSNIYKNIDISIYNPYLNQRRIFSDSIIIWSNTINSLCLEHLIDEISNIQRIFFESGILTRGSVVKDNSYDQIIDIINNQDYIKQNKILDEILISPALIKAVLKEEKIKLPKVIIDDQLFDDIKKSEQEMNIYLNYKKDHMNDLIVDGYFCDFNLRLISNLISDNILQDKSFNKEEYINFNKIKIINYLRKIKEIIIKGLSENKENDIFEKWNYIKKEYNFLINNSIDNLNEIIELLL